VRRQSEAVTSGFVRSSAFRRRRRFRDFHLKAGLQTYKAPATSPAEIRCRGLASDS